MSDDLPPDWHMLGDDAALKEPDDMPPPIGERIHVGEPTQPSRKMRIEWFADACAAALSEPSNPLIADMLDEGAMSVIYGESNSGKTFVALDMAMAVATGTPWNGKATKHGLVVYVAAEGGKRIMRRLAALKKRYDGRTRRRRPDAIVGACPLPDRPALE